MKKSDKLFTTAIILAAGDGERFGGDVRKQLVSVNGKSILRRSVEAFYDCDLISAIVVVTKEEDIPEVKNDLHFASDKIYAIVAGGIDRASSAEKGFMNAPAETDFVAIHDAARCLINSECISNVLKKAYETGAASAATHVTDTVKELNSGNIVSTVPRENLALVQTPQAFSKELYELAIGKKSNMIYTDDNMLLEALGLPVTPVYIDIPNIKITTKSDLEFAEFLILRKERLSHEYRIGRGYDVHRLTEGRKLILGGVEIPFEKGLLGHSDADVLIHAIIDSLLGAVGSGDIGRNFPDSAQEYCGISSLVLLDKVSDIVYGMDYEIINIDATVILQAPKLVKYVEAMKTNIANSLKISTSRLNIKATTEEGLGFTGRGEGIKAEAESLLRKSKRLCIHSPNQR